MRALWDRLLAWFGFGWDAHRGDWTGDRFEGELHRVAAWLLRKYKWPRIDIYRIRDLHAIKWGEARPIKEGILYGQVTRRARHKYTFESVDHPEVFTHEICHIDALERGLEKSHHPAYRDYVTGLGRAGWTGLAGMDLPAGYVRFIDHLRFTSELQRVGP